MTPTVEVVHSRQCGGCDGRDGRDGHEGMERGSRKEAYSELFLQEPLLILWAHVRR
jgi:hypothetical protein